MFPSGWQVLVCLTVLYLCVVTRGQDLNRQKRSMESHYTDGSLSEYDGPIYLKRPFDTLGGTEVHNFKRSDTPYDYRYIQQQYSIGPNDIGNSFTSQDEQIGKSSTADRASRRKRILDSLGMFQVHGWKRSARPRNLQISLRQLLKLLNTQEDSDDLVNIPGVFQSSAARKRALDSLGGYQIHHWKRSVDIPTTDGWVRLHRSRRSAGTDNSKATERPLEVSSADEMQQGKPLELTSADEMQHEKPKNEVLLREASQSDSETPDFPIAERALYEIDELDDPNQKRALDSLGGFHVHGMKRALDSLGGFHVHGMKRDSSDLDNEKRALDSLGGFNVHGMKRALDSLGGFNVHGMKRALDSLGGFNVHGMKRALDSLGGFNVHGMKRALDSLGGFNVHGMKRDSSDLDNEKRALDSLGGFNVHGMKRALDSLGGFNIHGMKKDSFGSENEKRALDSLGSFQIHGMKRQVTDKESSKRALDSLGGFHVHGMKRFGSSLGEVSPTGDKRALDSLGGFQIHGWKRALDSLGGFQVHGWKRNGISSSKDKEAPY